MSGRAERQMSTPTRSGGAYVRAVEGPDGTAEPLQVVTNVHSSNEGRSMYAIVRESTYDTKALKGGKHRLDEFQALHEKQPGYAGTVVVELSAGRWLTVNLWKREEDARAALPVMVPVVERLLEPMMTQPSEVIGAGPVVLTDLTKP